MGPSAAQASRRKRDVNPEQRAKFKKAARAKRRAQKDMMLGICLADAVQAYLANQRLQEQHCDACLQAELQELRSSKAVLLQQLQEAQAAGVAARQAMQQLEQQMQQQAAAAAQATQPPVQLVLNIINSSWAAGGADTQDACGHAAGASAGCDDGWEQGDDGYYDDASEQQLQRMAPAITPALTSQGAEHAAAAGPAVAAVVAARRAETSDMATTAQAAAGPADSSHQLVSSPGADRKMDDASAAASTADKTAGSQPYLMQLQAKLPPLWQSSLAMASSSSSSLLPQPPTLMHIHHIAPAMLTPAAGAVITTGEPFITPGSKAISCQDTHTAATDAAPGINPATAVSPAPAEQVQVPKSSPAPSATTTATAMATLAPAQLGSQPAEEDALLAELEQGALAALAFKSANDEHLSRDYARRSPEPRWESGSLLFSGPFTTTLGRRSDRLPPGLPDGRPRRSASPDVSRSPSPPLLAASEATAARSKSASPSPSPPRSPTATKLGPGMMRLSRGGSITGSGKLTVTTATPPADSSSSVITAAPSKAGTAAAPPQLSSAGASTSPSTDSATPPPTVTPEPPHQQQGQQSEAQQDVQGQTAGQGKQQQQQLTSPRHRLSRSSGTSTPSTTEEDEEDSTTPAGHHSGPPSPAQLVVMQLLPQVVGMLLAESQGSDGPGSQPGSQEDLLAAASCMLQMASQGPEELAALPAGATALVMAAATAAAGSPLPPASHQSPAGAKPHTQAASKVLGWLAQQQGSPPDCLLAAGGSQGSSPIMFAGQKIWTAAAQGPVAPATFSFSSPDSASPATRQQQAASQRLRQSPDSGAPYQRPIKALPIISPVQMSRLDGSSPEARPKSSPGASPAAPAQLVKPALAARNTTATAAPALMDAMQLLAPAGQPAVGKGHQQGSSAVTQSSGTARSEVPAAVMPGTAQEVVPKQRVATEAAAGRGKAAGKQQQPAGDGQADKR